MARRRLRAAWLGGADRIELCSAMHLDGLAPDARHIRIARDAFAHRPGLLVMVRPRVGDFFYSADEITRMLGEIEIAHQHGADGVVLGVLRAEDCRIAHSWTPSGRSAIFQIAPPSPNGLSLKPDTPRGSANFHARQPNLEP